MANTTVVTGDIPAPKGLFARLVGIITAPTETFRAVVAHPKVLGMLLVTSVGVAALTTAPMLTEAGKEAALQEQVKQTERWTGQPVDDKGYERMRQMGNITPFFSAGAILIFSPIMALIVGGILFAIFNAAMGGTATFKQVMAVVVHAGVISLLHQAITAPINIARGGVTSITSLGGLAAGFDEGSFVARLLGMIDLFTIWYVIVLAIGLGVLYRRRAQPIAMTLLGIFVVIIVAIAAVMS